MKKFKFNIYCILFSIVLYLFCSTVYANDNELITHGTEMGDFKTVDTIPENYIYDKKIEKELSSLINFYYSFPYILVQDVDRGELGSHVLPYNDNFVIKKGDKDRNKYVNKDIVEKYLPDAKKVYEDRTRIYQIGEKIKKRPPYSSDSSAKMNVIVEEIQYAKEYNGKTIARNKKFFIIKLEKYLSHDETSYGKDEIFSENLIYEVFSTSGTRYTQYDYNEEELSYGFEIDEDEVIEFVTIRAPEGNEGIGRNFRRTIRVLEEGEEPSIKIDELEFKKVDTIPENYIEIEKFPFPPYAKVVSFENYEKYTYVDKKAQSICFYFHLPYIYVTDLDGGIFETVTMDSTAFLKSNKNGKVYVKDSFIQKYLDRANQVKEEREKTYHLGETITKTANNDSQKKVEYIVESSKYTNEYNGKKAEDDRIFFIVKLKKREVSGFGELEKKSIRTVKYFIDENGREEYGYEKIYNPEEDSYCFEISKDTIISSLVIGIGEEKNESTDFEIGKDFFREIKL